MLFVLFLSTFVSTFLEEGIVQMDDKKSEKTTSTYTTNHEEMMEIISEKARELEKKEVFDPTNPFPPWEIIPNIPMTHMAWRMGSGEDYRRHFNKYFVGLKQQDRKNYIVDYPEPEGWNGYYQLIIGRSEKREPKE